MSNHLEKTANDMSRFVVEKKGITNRKDLCTQIAEATTVEDKKELAKRIAIAANTLKWSETDLHALFRRKDDPTIYNFTGFVKWSIEIT
jgi:hypothetical protein